MVYGVKKYWIIIFFIVTMASFWYTLNLFYYGTWNPFQTPKIISCFGRDYLMSKNPPVTLISDKKPNEKVHSFVYFITGKKIFISQPKGKDYDPGFIYLYIGNDKYIPYILSGGP